MLISILDSVSRNHEVSGIEAVAVAPEGLNGDLTHKRFRQSLPSDMAS